MNEVVLDDHEVRTFTQILAQDLALKTDIKAVCVVLYDEDGNRISVTPIDPLQ